MSSPWSGIQSTTNARHEVEVAVSQWYDKRAGACRKLNGVAPGPALKVAVPPRPELLEAGNHGLNYQAASLPQMTLGLQKCPAVDKLRGGCKTALRKNARPQCSRRSNALEYCCEAIGGRSLSLRRNGMSQGLVAGGGNNLNVGDGVTWRIGLVGSVVRKSPCKNAVWRGCVWDDADSAVFE